MTESSTLRLTEAPGTEGNRRFRVELGDGRAVECVLYRGDTLCVSSQVGCAVRCPFCASGKDGLLRSLRADELVGQLRAVQALGAEVKRTTVSGVGEPLHNVEAVRGFVEACRAEGIAPSLTTSGGPIARLSEALHWPHNGLTLSVHAGDEATRAKLVPHAPSLEALHACLREQWPALSRTRRRKTALAYLLIAGENDSDRELDRFAAWARALEGARVHLYAHNPVPSSPLRGVGRERYLEVAARLRAAGLYVQLSSTARLEANGGCGTLVMEGARKPRASRLAVTE